MQTRKTFFGESSATVKTLAEILYLIDNKSGQTVSRLNSVIADNKAHSALVSTGISDVFGRLQTRKTFFGESEPTIKSVAEILYLSDNRLAQIVARIEDVRSYTGQTNTLLSKGLDDVLGSLQTRKIFSGDSEVTVKSVAEILYLSDNRLAQIVARIEDVRSYSSQTNTLLSKGFDDVLSSLADFNFSADIPSVDLSETNKFLGRLTGDVASIRDKFVLQDSLSDLLDLLVGDLQVPQTHAAISRIQDVMSTRFPFCIPSVVNVVLFGSLLADPAPPVWTFDIAGSPLVVDFADYGAFAEVSSWTVRLLFTAALLLNTRRFVYGLGGGY
ncbi:hypothetical protein DX903_05060 [Adlercreutzia equolifaciens]|nr:hypothetical protein DX903_05060 [Adlercreutzia equolifaciens]